MEIDTAVKPTEAANHPSRRRGLLGDLALSQHGAVARRQLVELGFTRHEITGMVSAGWLHRVHYGVYAVGRRSLGPRGRWMAAVLACGPGALLSHRSSAAHRRLRASAQRDVEVTVPRDRGRRLQGVRVYVVGDLGPADGHVHEGIPCVTVARTLLGLAAVLPRRAVERACDEAELRRVFDLAASEELLARSTGRRGAAVLRAVLDEHEIGTTLTREGLEERVLNVLDRHGVARPEVNAWFVCRPGVGFEVDFLWRDERLVLEADGGPFHSTRAAIERDRRKEAELTCAGVRVLRCTWLQAQREPHRLAAMVRAALAQDRDAGAARPRPAPAVGRDGRRAA